MVLGVATGLLYAGFHFAAQDKAVAERWNRVIGKGEGFERLFTGEGNFRLKLLQPGIS